MIKKIGVQGGKGSFSEVAGLKFAHNKNLKNFQLEYLISTENVLKAVNQTEVDYGIFAIENAQGGVVIESIYALSQYNCHIESMFHILVQQNLLVLPGVELDEITEIHSHQQALKQCRNFLAQQFWGLPLVEENDTAESARRLQKGELIKTAAVIANQACAELYGLNILAPDIHDLKNNLTLFLAVTKR